MALSRAQFEVVLIDRAAAALAMVGRDSTTVDGTNAALSDPIRSAMESLGYAVADPTSPADSDLAAVPTTSYGLLFDLAERRTLETVLNNWTGVDEKFGQDSQANSQYVRQLQARIADLDRKIAAPRSGMGGGAVVTRIDAGRSRPGKVGFGDPRRWPNP